MEMGGEGTGAARRPAGRTQQQQRAPRQGRARGGAAAAGAASKFDLALELPPLLSEFNSDSQNLVALHSLARSLGSSVAHPRDHLLAHVDAALGGAPHRAASLRAHLLNCGSKDGAGDPDGLSESLRSCLHAGQHAERAQQERNAKRPRAGGSLKPTTLSLNKSVRDNVEAIEALLRHGYDRDSARHRLLRHQAKLKRQFDEETADARCRPLWQRFEELFPLVDIVSHGVASEHEEGGGPGAPTCSPALAPGAAVLAGRAVDASPPPKKRARGLRVRPANEATPGATRAPPTVASTPPGGRHGAKTFLVDGGQENTSPAHVAHAGDPLGAGACACDGAAEVDEAMAATAGTPIGGKHFYYGGAPAEAMATGVATAEDPAVAAELLVPPLPTGHEGLGFDIMSSQSLVDFLMDVTP